MHAQKRGDIIPYSFGLLTNKTEAIYIKFCCKVFNRVLRQGNNPNDTLVDFERAAVNATHHLNQHREIKVCFYHLRSNIWKRTWEFSLKQQYNEDQGFSLSLRILGEITFLLPNDVILGFEKFADHPRNFHNGDEDDLLEYFEDTYIARC